MFYLPVQNDKYFRYVVGANGCSPKNRNGMTVCLKMNPYCLGSSFHNTWANNRSPLPRSGHFYGLDYSFIIGQL
jgi:hypothetical protein